ncbi:MAG: hypothetical protein WBB79_01275 [Candidatus Macondimonas sp.]
MVKSDSRLVAGLGLGQHMAQGQPGEVVPDSLPVLDMQPGR